MTNSNICSLCLEEQVLRKSHIIPKFVGKWLKETGTGYLVSAEDGSKRVQDIIKVELLCDECEEKLSKFEKYFAENIFFPFHNDTKMFEYDKNLELFLISLSWRVLKFLSEDFKSENSSFQSFFDKAMNDWRKFLLGENQNIEPYENHILFLDYLDDKKSTEIPPKINWYNLHGIDFTIFTTDKRMLVYVKLPWMIFVTSVEPTVMVGWKGTAIKNSGKITATDQSMEDGEFGRFIIDRANLALTYSSGPSPEVSQKRLLNVVERNPKKFLKSNTLRTMIAERDIQRKQKMKDMPKAVIAIVEEIMRPSIDDPNLDKANNQFIRWSSRQIADLISDLSKKEAKKLNMIVEVTIQQAGILEKDIQHTFEGNSLWITFMVHPNTTKEYQRSKITSEIERLQKQIDKKIPIAVFSVNMGDDNSSYESGFFIPATK